MTLTLTTKWSLTNHRRYLIVTVSADENAEATASQIYLDIRMPEGSRIRHLGNQPTDGHGRSIGMDLRDLKPGEQETMVFRVKSRDVGDNAGAPELHLHWIDSESGALMEHHQTGSPMPTESTGDDDDLAEIVANARANRRRSWHRRHHRCGVGPGFIPSRSHKGRHFHAVGRKMGRMAHRAFDASWQSRDGRSEA